MDVAIDVSVNHVGLNLYVTEKMSVGMREHKLCAHVSAIILDTRANARARPRCVGLTSYDTLLHGSFDARNRKSHLLEHRFQLSVDKVFHLSNQCLGIVESWRGHISANLRRSPVTAEDRVMMLR